MPVEPRGYDIYHQTTGQWVARIGSDGVIQEKGDLLAVEMLKTLLQRLILVREELSAPGNYDPFPEESMCYLGLMTLHPDDPGYLSIFMRRLPVMSEYEARLVKAEDLNRS